MLVLTDDGRFEIRAPGYFDVGSRLVELGVPPAEVIDEHEQALTRSGA